MQQMSRGMIGADRGARRVIDLEFERRAERELALFDLDLVNDQVAKLLLCVENARLDVRAEHETDIADLTARLAIEGRLIEDRPAALALRQRLRLGAVAHDGA